MTASTSTDELVDLWAEEQDDEIHLIWSCIPCGAIIKPGSPGLWMGSCGIPTPCVEKSVTCRVCLGKPRPSFCSRCGGAA